MTREEILNQIATLITDPQNKQNTAEKVRQAYELLTTELGLKNEILVNTNRPITRTTWPNNINIGTVTSLQDFIEKVFYPSVPPVASLSIQGGTIREFGASNAVTLNWTVTKKTKGVNLIAVDGQTFTVSTDIDEDADPENNQQIGTKAGTATQNVDHVFTMLVQAASGSEWVNGSVTLVWRNKRYWGKSAVQAVADAYIIAADGASSGVGNEFSTTRAQTRNGMDGAGQYLFFAWPTSFGEPSFTVNGLPNTAWTKIRDNSPFTNASGYTENYDVWVSNTVQNSALNIIVS